MNSGAGTAATATAAKERVRKIKAATVGASERANDMEASESERANQSFRESLARTLIPLGLTTP